VINDATYQILLIVKILWNLKGVIVDVEAAVLIARWTSSG
jgi:hypothetical protein